MTRKYNTVIVTLILLAFYVGSYAVLSRQGIEQADLQDSEVYYFVQPTSEGRVSSHMVCCLLYMPLIVIETRLGSQYYPDLCCRHSLS